MKIAELIDESKAAALALGGLLAASPVQGETVKGFIDQVISTAQKSNKDWEWGYQQIEKKFRNSSPAQMAQIMGYYNQEWANPSKTYSIDLPTDPGIRKPSRLRVP